MEKIPYSKQALDAADIQSVVEILNDPLITQGPKVSEFEQAFARYCGAKYAVAVSSGTSALTIANKALGLQAGEHVITTANTFVATANSIALNGGVPHLVDIDKNDFNISMDHIEANLESQQQFKGIIPVHFAGSPVDMEALSTLAKKHGLYTIEDGCHALGGVWSDSRGTKHRIGDCSYSDVTTFSFHPVKHITTGEGGMVTTNNETLYRNLLSLRSHGILNPADNRVKKAQPWLYEMHNLSANHRITDFQCALGLSQLSKNDGWCLRRSELVKQYDTAFHNSLFVKPQARKPINKASYHLYVIQAQRRDELYHYLHQQNILVQVHYIPVHFHPYYQNQFGYKIGDFPNCEAYYDKALSLPLYPTLSDSGQDRVIATIQDFYNGC